jgi:hypothetical protein
VKLTGIFKKTVKPIRKGIYTTRIVGMDGSKDEWLYSYWNGKLWSDSRSSVAGASFFIKHFDQGIQDKEWRGIVK